MSKWTRARTILKIIKESNSEKWSLKSLTTASGAINVSRRTKKQQTLRGTRITGNECILKSHTLDSLSLATPINMLWSNEKVHRERNWILLGNANKHNCVAHYARSVNFELIEDTHQASTSHCLIKSYHTCKHRRINTHTHAENVLNVRQKEVPLRLLLFIAFLGSRVSHAIFSLNFPLHVLMWW